MPGLNALIAFLVGTGLAAVLTFVAATQLNPSAKQPDQHNVLLYGNSTTYQQN